MKQKLMTTTLIIITLAALASAWYGWTHPKPGPAGQKEYIQVQVPKPYAVITRQTVTITEIKVITKTEVIEKTKWPDWFKNDPNQQLTAIGIIEPYKGKTECASIINIGTGESRIVAKQLPMPLFGLENTVRVSGTLGYGFAIDGEWAFLRVGNFYGSAKGIFASNGENSVTVVGATITHEW